MLCRVACQGVTDVLQDCTEGTMIFRNVG